jgi:hypothetical protein
MERWVLTSSSSLVKGFEVVGMSASLFPIFPNEWPERSRGLLPDPGQLALCTVGKQGSNPERQLEDDLPSDGSSALPKDNAWLVFALRSTCDGYCSTMGVNTLVARPRSTWDKSPWRSNETRVREVVQERHIIDQARCNIAASCTKGCE